MSITSPTSRTLILSSLIAFIPACYIYYKSQNKRPRIGGHISSAKMLWLGYALFIYFILCPILAFDPAIQYIYRAMLGTFTALILARAVFQTGLMYFLKKWSPIVGISYNMFCLFLLSVEIFLFKNEIRNSLRDSYTYWRLLLIGIVASCLITDSVYAFKFYRIVGDKTYGDAGVWFASEEDLRFKAINRLTATVNVGFYTGLIVFLIGIFVA